MNNLEKMIDSPPNDYTEEQKNLWIKTFEQSIALGKRKEDAAEIANDVADKVSSDSRVNEVEKELEKNGNIHAWKEYQESKDKAA